MSSDEEGGLDERVLLLAPTAKDARAAGTILASMGIRCFACASLDHLCSEIDRGAGVAIVPEEVILKDVEGRLARTLRGQPRWSDFPLVILTPPHADPPKSAEALRSIGHMTLMRRPIEVRALASTIRAALRDRGRQYERRDYLVERERYAESLRENEERLTFALEAASLGSWELNLATGAIECTPLCKSNLGLPPQSEPSHDILTRRIHPEDRIGVESALDRALGGHADFDVEYRNLWDDGSVHWIMVRGRAVRDEGGTPARMVGVSLDITARKMAENQQQFLIALNDAIRSLANPEELMRVVEDAAGGHFGVSRCTYAEIHADQGRFTIANDYTDGVRSIAGTYDLDDFGPEIIRGLKGGRTLVIPDVRADERTAGFADAFARMETRAVLCVPLVKEGRFLASFTLQQDEPRAWSAPDVSLAEQVAERTWLAVENARTQSELRKSEGKLRFLAGLDAATQPLTDPEEITITAARALGEHLGADRSAYAEVGEDEDSFQLMGDFNRGVPSIVGRYRFSAFGAEVLRLMRENKPYVIDDVDASDRAGADLSAYRSTLIRAVICVPLHKGGRLVAAMAVHQATPRRWTAEEVELVQLVAARCWESIERAKAARAIRESEEQFRTLAESIPQLAWMARPDGQIFWYNRRWYDFTGTTFEEMEGWGWQSVHDPVELQRVISRFKAAIASGEPWEDTFPLRRHDGAMRWHLSRALPVRDQQGRIERWFGTNTDITEQEQAAVERERRFLREQKRTERLGALAKLASRLNAAHDVGSVLQIITEEARVLLGADRAVTSLGEEGRPSLTAESTSRGLDLGANSAPPSMPRASGLDRLSEASYRPLRLGREELEAEVDRGATDESRPGPVPMSGWLGAALTGRNGRIIGLIQLSDKIEGEFDEDDEALLQQLSQMAAGTIENARLYDQLRENDKRKDEFLAMLAHELRNPIAAVNNAVTVLKMSSDEENRNWASDVVERQVKQLVRLIDDLLDVSRITSGKIRLRRESIDAGPILQQAVESARPLIDERKHELVVTFEEGRLPLRADPTRLEQIVVNLLTNAAKYTEDGGRIRLSADREGGEIVIRIRDNGIGIPAEKLPEMFQLFAQGERSIARSEGGLGIGLTVVRRLAEMHGGTVVASSEGPGRGSEFVVRLPAEEVPRHSSRPEPAQPSVARKAARILVVDDNVDTARGMARLLKLLGNEVAIAYDGNMALELARTFEPEFVLLDIGLPGIDGYQVARKLREEACGKDCVIIAVSGYGQEEDRKRSRAAGFNHHLVKPVDFDSLVSLIGRTS